MANYLLVEDNKTQWSKYSRRINSWIESAKKAQDIPREKRMFANLESHGLNAYFPDFEEIQSNLKAAMESGTLDVIFSDIALGGDENYGDDSAWIDIVLKNIIEHSRDIQQRLRERNMGLIIMTRHSGDVLASFIERSQLFLNTWFPGWVFLRKDSFTDSFRPKFNELAANYQEVQGRWCHLSKVADYRNNQLGRVNHRFEISNEVVLRREQIIAIVAEQHNVNIYYTDNPRESPLSVRHIKPDKYGRQDVQDDFRGVYLDLSQGKPDDFDIEDHFFLNIKDRPLTIINMNFGWTPERNNHGRTLRLQGAREHVEVHCRFDWLNKDFPLR